MTEHLYIIRFPFVFELGPALVTVLRSTKLALGITIPRNYTWDPSQIDGTRSRLWFFIIAVFGFAWEGNAHEINQVLVRSYPDRQIFPALLRPFSISRRLPWTRDALKWSLGTILPSKRPKDIGGHIITRILIALQITVFFKVSFIIFPGNDNLPSRDNPKFN